ncbi:MAG: hypothetical protein H3C35_13095 [Bacteroidetes bacterium]|nr:hypothetical protein [Bacteroidota bacterium]
MLSQEIHNLKQNIFSLLGKNYTHRQVNEIIALCHAIANAYLRNTVINGTAKQEYLGINQSDIAFDCIADLFRKDEQGNFVQLQAYFESFNVHELSEREILTHIRRIVSSRVNQGMFRIYQEADPVLGKIIRNIKLALQIVKNFNETERFGEIHIAPINCDALAHLQTIDSNTLARELQTIANGSEHIPHILSKLALYLREQKEFRRSVPIVTVALAIRTLYTGELKINDIEQPTAENELFVADANKTIHDSCAHVKTSTAKKYISTKRISSEIFENYFSAIEKNLGYSILGVNGEDTSLFGALKNKMPKLTPEQYKKHHRSTVEYLALLCKEEAVKRLKKNNSY